MPNVEIHGLDQTTAIDVRKKIFVVLSALRGFKIDDLVVTIFPTNVSDATGKSSPFLRLVDTPNDNWCAVTDTLRTALRMDVEYMRLYNFLPNNPKKK